LQSRLDAICSHHQSAGEEDKMARSSLYVMRFATALAIILSVASMSYAYYSNRMVSELAQRIEDAEKKLGQVVKDQQKIDAIEAKLQKLAPTDGPK
jgi:glucosamine 6-phosphate synthetase-like amidotransferase/phosphosugar isomerase protein